MGRRNTNTDSSVPFSAHLLIRPPKLRFHSISKPFHNRQRPPSPIFKGCRKSSTKCPKPDPISSLYPPQQQLTGCLGYQSAFKEAELLILQLKHFTMKAANRETTSQYPWLF